MPSKRAKSHMPLKRTKLAQDERDPRPWRRSATWQKTSQKSNLGVLGASLKGLAAPPVQLRGLPPDMKLYLINRLQVVAECNLQAWIRITSMIDRMRREP